MKDFLSALQENVLVCDGAMGTMLYNKGIFISRCFDELNISDPDLVRNVHLDYISAGVDIIETNTFGANRTRLMAHGLAGNLEEINRNGAQIARSAASGGVFVAGAIGPLGAKVENANAVFREQAAPLHDGGVDLFILETFQGLTEVLAAIRGVREVSDRPIVAQMAVAQDGNTHEGASPEVFARRLDEAGADVIGLNCSVGPQTMLDTIERIAAVTRKPLSVQPNAGMPSSIEGRSIYLCSPEYMASYSRKFVQYGVRVVGACCGTTPAHIKAIRSAVRERSR